MKAEREGGERERERERGKEGGGKGERERRKRKSQEAQREEQSQSVVHMYNVMHVQISMGTPPFKFYFFNTPCVW